MSGTAPPPLSPELDELAAAFYQECGKGRLCFQRCSSCGRWRHLPRHLCAACGSAEWAWAPSSGRGRIHSWTVTHRTPHPVFAASVPYAVVVVEMDEGVRLVSGLRGLDPAALALDLPVRVELEPATGGMAVPWFRPA
jgi:uncharacterized OB-fold protein